MLANPYVLIATGVAGLAFVMYKLVTAETAAETAQRKHNEAMEEAQERKENLISKTGQLIRKINDETQTIYAQVNAWRELQKEMPETFGSMSMQEFKGMDSSSVDKLVNTAAENRELAEFNKSLKEAEETVERLRNRIKYNSDGQTVALASNQLRVAEELLKKKREEKAERESIAKQAAFEAKSDEEKLKILNEQAAAYQKQYDEIESLVPASERVGKAIVGISKDLAGANSEWKGFDIQTQINVSKLESLNSKIKETQAQIGAIATANASGVSYAEAKALAKKEYDVASKALDEIVKNSKQYSETAYKDAVKNLSEKKKAYEELGGETKPKNSKENKDYTDQLTREAREREKMEKDMAFAVEQVR
ncbi:MAG: hypothetical protein ACRC9X_03450, partial [Bacteroidales bacterium]